MHQNAILLIVLIMDILLGLLFLVVGLCKNANDFANVNQVFALGF